MYLRTLAGFGLFVAILATGCGEKNKSTSTGGSPSAEKKVMGILSKMDTKTGTLELLIDGKPVTYTVSEKIVYFDDSVTKHIGALKHDWFNEYIVATLEEQGGQEVVTSLRPPSNDMLPPDPPGKKITGKLVGWRVKKYPDSTILLEIDGNVKEFPAAAKVTWYDQFGFKAKGGDPLRNLLNHSVTLLIVPQEGKEEVLIVRSINPK
jgi:hypothetical protein